MQTRNHVLELSELKEEILCGTTKLILIQILAPENTVMKDQQTLHRKEYLVVLSNLHLWDFGLNQKI